MADKKLMGKIEAVLFASGDPVEVAKLSQILKADKGEIDLALEDLKKKYNKNNSGIIMLELDQSIQLSNKPEYGEYIKQALLVKKNAPLSSAAMETLAIIAYNQPEPVTKSFIEQIRGVDSSQTVNSLVEKGLIEEAGRHNLPGRPIVYRTTEIFLRNFGISNLTELPPLPSGESEQIGFEQLEITPNINEPTAENVEEVETAENMDEVEIAENVEEVETTENVEEVETVENVEEVETVENVEEVETAENMDEVEIAENVDEVETAENVEEVETVENVDEVETAENMDEVEITENVNELETVENNIDIKEEL